MKAETLEKIIGDSNVAFINKFEAGEVEQLAGEIAEHYNSDEGLAELFDIIRKKFFLIRYTPTWNDIINQLNDNNIEYSDWSDMEIISYALRNGILDIKEVLS